jgi:hypothetical protein
VTGTEFPRGSLDKPQGVDAVVRGQQQPVVGQPGRQPLLATEFQEVSGDLLVERSQLGVGLLGTPAEQFERRLRGDAVDDHQHALGLFYGTAGLGNLSDRSGDNLVVTLDR